MKCPLIMIGVEAWSVKPPGTEGNCLKADCAWWDDAEGRCAVLYLTYKLARLKDVLDETRDRLHGRLSS